MTDAIISLTGASAAGIAGMLPPKPSGVKAVGSTGLLYTASATAIFNLEGFDHQSGQDDLLRGTLNSVSPNATVSLSTTTPYGAGCSLDVRVTAGASSTAGYAVCSPGPQYIGTASLGVMTRSNVNSSIATYVGLSSNDVPHMFCRLSGGNIALYRGSPQGSPTLINTAIGVIPSSGWFFLELSVVIAPGTGGSVVIRVNGIQVASYSSINTSSDGTSVMNGVLLGGVTPGGTSADFLFDDLYVATSLLGPVRVSTLYPSANGSQVQLLPSAAGANWQQVADLSMDSDLTFNFTKTLGLSDQLALTALPGSITTIYGLKVTAAARIDADTPLAISTLVASGGTTVYGVRRPLSNVYQYLSTVYATDPNTGTAWTASGVNAAQIGYGNVV